MVEGGDGWIGLVEFVSRRGFSGHEVSGVERMVCEVSTPGTNGLVAVCMRCVQGTVYEVVKPGTTGSLLCGHLRILLLTTTSFDHAPDQTNGVRVEG